MEQEYLDLAQKILNEGSEKGTEQGRGQNLSLVIR